MAIVFAAALLAPSAAVAARTEQSVILSHRVEFASDNVKVYFYLNQIPEIKHVESRNRFDYVIDFERCVSLRDRDFDKVGDALVDSIEIVRNGKSARARIRTLQLTQTRIMKGHDRQRNREYVVIVFYRPYEGYSKYEARLEEIARCRKEKIPVVLIDPGHGGKDPGAEPQSGVTEKSLNLKFASAICNNINETGLARAYLTRYTDDFLSLGRRVFLANQYGSDIFVSIHFNANKSRSIRGFEAYYMSYGAASDNSAQILADLENSSEQADESIAAEEDFQVQSILLDLREKENIKESGILAEIISRNMHGIPGYPVSKPKQANFAVLRNLSMPSVLIEVGYLTSRGDVVFAGKKENFDEICARIAVGIINYVCDKGSISVPSSGYPVTVESIGSAASSEAPAAAPRTAKKSERKAAAYVVRRGDTLAKISRKFKVSIDRILKENGKAQDSFTIYPGEKLRIPDASEN